MYVSTSVDQKLNGQVRNAIWQFYQVIFTPIIKYISAFKPSLIERRWVELQTL